MFCFLNTKSVCTFLASTTILLANFTTCLAQQQAWHVYGVDPFNPKQPAPQVRFSPLQLATNGNVASRVQHCVIAPSFGNAVIPMAIAYPNQTPLIEHEQFSQSTLGVISNGQQYLGDIRAGIPMAEFPVNEYPTSGYPIGNSTTGYSLAPGEYVISEDPVYPNISVANNPLEIVGELKSVSAHNNSAVEQALPNERVQGIQSVDGTSVLSSPSDIAIASPNSQRNPETETISGSKEFAPGSPDLAGPVSVAKLENDSETLSAELDSANKTIAALEEKLITEISKSRSAIAQADASKKTATSAKQNAEKLLAKMKEANATKADSIATSAIEKLEQQIKELEEDLVHRQKEKEAAIKKQIGLEEEKTRMQEAVSELAKQNKALEQQMEMANVSAEQASRKAQLAMEQASRQLVGRKNSTDRPVDSKQGLAAEAVKKLQRQAARSASDSRSVNPESERARQLAAEKRMADEKAADLRATSKRLREKRDARRKEIERKAAADKQKEMARTKAAKEEEEAKVAATLAAREQAMKEARSESELKANKNSDGKDAVVEKSKSGNSKKRRAQTSTAEQIKKLQASMELQIKKSKVNISKRTQSKIAKIKKDGKKDSDLEIIRLKAKMESDIKANEKVIRKRIEGRIKRLRREEAARSKS